MKGWGPKTSVCPSNPRETKLLAGYLGILPGNPGGARKVRERKVCVQFSFPKEASKHRPRAKSSRLNAATSRASQA